MVIQSLSAWVSNEFLPREFPMLEAGAIHPLDGRFNPDDFDIRNSVAKSCRILRFSNIDQESTLQLFTSKPNLSWTFRPATGTSLAYTCGPETGLCASSVDESWEVHTSEQLCESSSSELPAIALFLYEQHNTKRDDEPLPLSHPHGVRKEISMGNLPANG